MLTLLKPSDEKCQLFLTAANSADLNYTHVGCLSSKTPKGFNRDAFGCSLGSGKLFWRAAVEAFNQWRFMPSSMVEIKNAGPIEEGRVVGVLLKAAGTWSLNPARIIEVHDSRRESPSGLTIFGFTYGTLVGHVEEGEERFLLTWDHATDEVRYEIEAVSRPNHFLAWLVYPYSRLMQARFRRESCAEIAAAVKEKVAL